MIACERQSLEMSCQAGEEIHVVQAAYGRLNDEICPTIWKLGTLSAQLPSSTSLCLSTNSLWVVSNRFNAFKKRVCGCPFRCNGEERCMVEAENSVFGDPCYGVEKYLEVWYTCKPKNME